VGYFFWDSYTWLIPAHIKHRYLTFGLSESERLLLISHTEVAIESGSSVPERRVEGSGGSMEKDKIPKIAGPRTEYKLSDFSVPMVRGKYANNEALLSLIRIARACTHADEHPGRRAKARG
jgi:hypothetical protein